LSNYLDSGAPRVVRGGFYAWFNDPLERLLTELLRRAQVEARNVPKLLPGLLGTVSDWRIVDSTTMPDQCRLHRSHGGCSLSRQLCVRRCGRQQVGDASI